MVMFTTSNCLIGVLGFVYFSNTRHAHCRNYFLHAGVQLFKQEFISKFLASSNVRPGLPAVLLQAPELVFEVASIVIFVLAVTGWESFVPTDMYPVFGDCPSVLCMYIRVRKLSIILPKKFYRHFSYLFVFSLPPVVCQFLSTSSSVFIIQSSRQSITSFTMFKVGNLLNVWHPEAQPEWLVIMNAYNFYSNKLHAVTS